MPFLDFVTVLNAGHKLPRVDYTKSEIDTWGVVYNKLGGYTRQFAIEQYNRILPLLEKVRMSSATD